MNVNIVGLDGKPKEPLILSHCIRRDAGNGGGCGLQYFPINQKMNGMFCLSIGLLAA